MFKNYDRPFFFYGMSLFLPWSFWFIAAYISHLPNQNEYIIWQGILSILGLITPMLTAAYLFISKPVLFNDLKNRFLGFKHIRTRYLFLSVFMTFTALIVAQLFSVFIGHDLSQFYISGKASFDSALFSPWFLLAFAALAEELAWHSYGTDALCSKMNLFNASLVFSLYWAFWHLPLAFIKGYYHSYLIVQGWQYTLNFIVSMIIFVILMNWLYFKTGRSIMIAVLFHMTANVSNEIFATHPDSKIIQTIILLCVTIFILIREKQLFFTKFSNSNEEKI